ncbi:MAG: AI-2E family transporter [Bacilli bacterium]|nr:AI-2E family transporter [Bacilli bacterium]
MIRKIKDKEVDFVSLNHILKTGKKLINIGYFMAIVCLVLLGTYLIKEWQLLKYIGEFLVVISPIFIGFLIAWFFDPLVDWMQTKKLPRVVGCIIVYILLIGVMFLISYLFIPSLITQVKDFVRVAPTIFEEITDFALNLVKTFDSGNLVKTAEVKSEITNYVTNLGLSIGADLPKYILTAGKSIISGGVNFVLGLMIGFYLLFDFDKVNANIFKFIPKDWQEGYIELTHRINTSLRSYVQGVLLVMLLVFLTQSIGLTLAGLEAPILFALFCAVTDIIPYFGPYIGAIPAIIVGFTISPVTGVCVIISILVVQLLENNFYQPLIMGHTMKLHPVTIMAGLLIFGHFFGILGMVIATPAIACIKVFATFFNEKFGWIEKITES